MDQRDRETERERERERERRSSMIRSTWSMKDKEEARKRQEAPEAGERFFEAIKALYAACDRLYELGDLRLFDRVYAVLEVMHGYAGLDDLDPRTRYPGATA